MGFSTLTLVSLAIAVALPQQSSRGVLIASSSGSFQTLASTLQCWSCYISIAFGYFSALSYNSTLQLLPFLYLFLSPFYRLLLLKSPNGTECFKWTIFSKCIKFPKNNLLSFKGVTEGR